MTEVVESKKKKLGLGDLSQIRDISLQDILVILLDGEHDLDLKTRIINPKDMASLTSFSQVLGMNELEKSNNLLDFFIEVYERLMVSYKGKSREETIRAVIGIFEQEQVKVSIADRLTGNLK